MLRRTALVAVAGPSLIACNIAPLPEDFGTCELEMAVDSPKAAPTYHADVRPIVAARCTSCHVAGGVAPFSLTSHDEVFAFRDVIVGATESRRMPPWPPGRCCGEFRHDRSLTPAQIATLAAWADQGGPEGDPADAPPDPPNEEGLSRRDVELPMAEPYTPSEQDGDEMRCFLIDWPEEQATHITGLAVDPGDAGILHHSLVYAIPQAKVATYQSLDDLSDGPGWACPGGLAEGGDTVVGGWLPGSLGYDFPEGLGRTVTPGSKVILTNHYKYVPGMAAADRTTVGFRLEETVEREISGVVVYNPAWLLGKTMLIPAGETDATFTYGYDPTLVTGGKPFLVHGVSLHMHERGASGSLAIERQGGELECLLHVADWDYHWQGEYLLSDGVRVEPGDQLKVECHFDNSQANQPGGVEPVDQWWGDSKEMCIASLLISIE